LAGFSFCCATPFDVSTVIAFLRSSCPLQLTEGKEKQILNGLNPEMPIRTFAFLGAATTSWFGRAYFYGAAQCAEPSTSTDADVTSLSSSNSASSSSSISTMTIRKGEVWGVPWDSAWDSVLHPASKNVKRQVLLIRHGQYKNESGGHSDSERVLTPLGEQQARLTGEYLRSAVLAGAAPEIYADRAFRSVTSSNLTRAMQTAELIIENCDPGAKRIWQIDAALAERFPCDVQPPYPKTARPECHKIVESAFKKYIHRPRAGNESHVDVIVCHGNVIRYFLCRALQLPPEAWLRFSLPHCSVTSISIRGNGNVSVNAVGSVAHLPPAMQTLNNVA
jgi:serine/threonine-protein phosphatase PGAM5